MGADDARSFRQLLGTATIYILLWFSMVWSLRVGYWLTLLLAFPTAGFLMRLFMIQHDCGHGSYFRSRKLADRVGAVIGVLTLTPYAYWRKTHAYHHAHSGDLDFRGFGDVDTLTVKEYRALPLLGRLRYRLYRSPFVLFGVGGIFLFLIKHRYPWDIPKSWKQAWRSVWYTNAALAGIVTVAYFTIGLKALLLVHGPVLLITTSVGVWLFYVQHQFEDTYWHHHDAWEYFEASLHGSTHLVLPRWLEWITAHIGIHHVHHMSARIPNYRLKKVVEENPELQQATKITIWDGMKTLRLALWDEERGRLISFREARRVPA
ncbi:MAG: fatty acid desaturase [Gemmatimonadetes bacterium]|nr:MAG: fatty acid desaturase [Gemmatimonadota bacterium]